MSDYPISVTASLSQTIDIVTSPTASNYQQTGKTLHFPVNPNSTTWQYQLNRQSFDTYGGRVTQLLSVSIQQMSIQGDSGSRANLLNFFEGLKGLQEWQISQRLPLFLSIPTAGLSFTVYIQQIDIGFDPTSTTYPYNLLLQVEDTIASGGANNYANITPVDLKNILYNLFYNSAAANEIGFGNEGTTILSAYFAGMAGYQRYTFDKSILPSSSDLKNLSQPSDIGAANYGI